MTRFASLSLVAALLLAAASPALGQSDYESSPILGRMDYDSPDPLTEAVDETPASAPVTPLPPRAVPRDELAGEAALYVRVELIYARYAPRLRGAEPPAEEASLLVERTGELRRAVEQSPLPESRTRKILEAARQTSVAGVVPFDDRASRSGR